MANVSPQDFAKMPSEIASLIAHMASLHTIPQQGHKATVGNCDHDGIWQNLWSKPSSAQPGLPPYGS